MQRALIIAIGVVVAAGVCLAAAFFLWSSSAPTPTPAYNADGTSYIPSGGSVSVTPGTGAQEPGMFEVASELGGTITVKDFLKDAATIPDPNNAGHYYLAGQTTATDSFPEFSIVYTSVDQSFIVSLLKEPVADTRKHAEQVLVAKLGLSGLQACNLRYWVSIPSQVNSIYSGKNLGFSFCPGATKL